MILQPGELILVNVLFHQAAGSKVRPAVVLLDTLDDDFIAAPVTSRPRNSKFDLPVTDWKNAGLNVPSTIRFHKLTVLAKAEVIRVIGAPSDVDRKQMSRILSEMFAEPIF